ncbi:signal peptidase I [uncultured Enterococcus sp.]|uniref:signal peptidase I n=1 Tax=uncultured Enterococcus sp. TaxID=167972 RepID=UPI002AA86723|nr:signal peptidase I [uncultured Enterococcus sp.]
MNAEKRKANKKRKQRKLIIELALTFSLSIILLYVVTVSVFVLPKTTGYSMVPTVNDKERLFVYRWGNIKRFDLVYMKNANGERSIRRVIGLPGEEIDYRNGELYVNNELKAERFLSTVTKGESDEPLTVDFKLFDLLGTAQIPDKEYFVLGDNREYATDSRYYGFVDEKDIIGVVKARIFPFYDMRQF